MYKNYSIEDGLPSNYVYYVFKDSKGFLWLGTDVGLSRYNGYEFENFTMDDGLSDNDVFQIYEDSQNRIWFLTNNGRLCYFKNGKFHNSQNDPLLQGTDFDARLDCFYEDSAGNVWFGSVGDGMAYLNVENKFHKDDRFKKVFKIWENKSGEILALNALQLQVSIYNISLDKVYSKDDIGLDNANRTILHTNATMVDDSKLLVTTSNTFYLIDTEKYTLLESFTPEEIKETVVYIKKFSNERIGIGTFNGFYYLNAINGMDIETVGFLNNQVVGSVAIDDDGNTWYSTLENGVYVVPAYRSYTYTKDNGFPDNRVSFVDGNTSGEIALGFDQYYATLINDQIAVDNYDPREFVESNYQIKLATDPYFILNIKYLKDRLAVMTNHGMFFDDSDNNRVHIVSSLRDAEDFGNDGIWLSSPQVASISFNGLEQFNNAMTTVKRDSIIEFFCAEFANCILDKRARTLLWEKNTETLWIGLSDGLMIYKNGALKNLSDSLAELKSRVTDIIQYENSIWVSTYGEGIFQFNLAGEFIRRINTDDGLPSNICNALYHHNNSIWVASHDGLCELTLVNRKLFFDIYDDNYGLPSNKTNDVYARNDTVWIATDHGLTIIKKQHKQSNDTIPVYLTEFKVGNQSFDQLTNQNLSLNHSENNIEIAFVGLSFLGTKDIEYRYKLSESTEWVYTSNRRVSLANLAPDSYAFVVSARKKRGQWNEGTPPLRFVIYPPFWQTWWFIGISITVVLSIVWFILRRRYRNLALKAAMEFKMKSLADELEKNKSILSAHTLNMIQRNNGYEEIESNLTQVEGPGKSKIKNAIAVNKTFEKEWENFNEYFIQVNQGFYDNLKARHKSLTIYEKRLSALIKMNLTNREISSLLGVESKSIGMAKYRLKKKLQLPEDEDLAEFLQSI